jgi:hypothetical protein
VRAAPPGPSIELRRLAGLLRGRRLEVVETFDAQPPEPTRILRAERTLGSQPRATQLGGASASARAKRTLLLALEWSKTVLHVRQGGAAGTHTVAIAMSLPLVDHWMGVATPTPMLDRTPIGETAIGRESAQRSSRESGDLPQDAAAPEFFSPLGDAHGLLQAEEITSAVAAESIARLIELRAVHTASVQTLPLRDPSWREALGAPVVQRRWAV